MMRLDEYIRVGYSVVYNYRNVQIENLIFLAHHGIKGRKWGVKNGPPYPLDKANSGSKSKKLEKMADSGIIKSIDVDDFDLITYGKNISPEVSKTIVDTMAKCEKDNGFVISEISTDIKNTPSMGTSVLEIEPLANGLLRLNINPYVLSGKSLNAINELFKQSSGTVANSLEDAIIHESGHATLINGKTIAEIKKLYDELSNHHIEGVSDIAYEDGAECLAELEVLRNRGESVSDEHKNFYHKYMGRDY